jgi:hypothetical protein
MLLFQVVDRLEYHWQTDLGCCECNAVCFVLALNSVFYLLLLLLAPLIYIIILIITQGLANLVIHFSVFLSYSLGIFIMQGGYGELKMLCVVHFFFFAQ